MESSIVSLEGDESSLNSGNRLSPSFANPQLQASVTTELKDDNLQSFALDRTPKAFKAVESGPNLHSSLNVRFDNKIATLEPLPEEIRKVKESLIKATSKRLMTHNRKNRRMPLQDSSEDPSAKVDNLMAG